MNNPLPRRSNFLDQFKTGIKSPEQLAAEIDTGLSRVEEERANRLVGKLLSEMPEEIKESMGVSEYDETAPVESAAVINVDLRRAPATTGFQLPPREEAGLSNPNIVLDESQTHAVARLAESQYGCLIGAAGTGKTTVLKYVLDRIIYEDHAFDVRMLSGNQGLNIAMVSFTGMAVQVMKSNLPDWMHSSCKTIHSLLEFAPEQVESTKGDGMVRRFLPQRNNLRKLDHDIIMIDEASMVGVELWTQLLAACRLGTRIYMIGDLNQLPPIVGQSVFGFALGQWHVCELTKVHRQKDPGANRIVEVAHEVLNGQSLTFDIAKDNPDWRVIFQQLADDPIKAHNQILAILEQLRKRRVDPTNPDSPFIYDPYRDRVMTAGNGYEQVNTSAIHQHPINESLSELIEPPTPENPRILVDGGREHTKKFAVNLRVMATKNESPDTVNRVTNGMTGVITAIRRNGNYTGRWDNYGTEAEVKAATAAKLAHLRNGANLQHDLSEVAEIDFTADEDLELSGGQTQEEIEGGGASSHIIDVTFDNGATRTFSSKAGVGSLQLAYASTVAKCQGSQFDTAIIICHPAAKAMLSREWLYTAITRASQRVIILGTSFAIRQAVSKQKIRGATLADKIQRYLQMATEGERVGQVRVKMNVPLRVEDYNGQTVKTKYEYDLE